MTFLHLLQRLFSLLSLAVTAVGLYLIWSWWRLESDPPLIAPGVWAEPSNARLYLGTALIAWSLLGRLPVLALAARRGDDGARRRRGEGKRLAGADRSDLHVERHGPRDAPALVFVHGWGLDSTVWWEAKRDLTARFEVVVWDLPGLGRSTPPPHGRLSLEGFAADLHAVVSSLGAKSVVLVGHSIGGMIVQTYCRQYPESLGRQVAGVVLENTTHTDPTATTFLGGVLKRIEPLLAGVARADIALQPLVWAMNWHGYFSGSTHLAMRLAGFGTQPTRAQLDQAAWLASRHPPAIQAKGDLAMMRWDATADLPEIRTPALVFIGERDLVTRPEAGETIAARLPNARLARVPRAGHMGPVERADFYEKEVAAFADDVFTRGARWADKAGRRAAETAAPAQTQAPPEERPSLH